MGKGVVTRAPRSISCVGLGSCMAVTLYDGKQKIGGLAHIMLPDSARLNGSRPPYHCADTAIGALLDGLRSYGAARRQLVAKIAGGARMFALNGYFTPGVGEENIASVKHVLKQERIPVIGEDTGGHHGRSLEFRLDSGILAVKAIGRQAIWL